MWLYSRIWSALQEKNAPRTNFFLNCKHPLKVYFLSSICQHESNVTLFLHLLPATKQYNIAGFPLAPSSRAPEGCPKPMASLDHPKCLQLWTPNILSTYQGPWRLELDMGGQGGQLQTQLLDSYVLSHATSFLSLFSACPPDFLSCFHGPCIR